MCRATDLTAGLPYDLAHAAYAARQYDALLGTYHRTKYPATTHDDDILDL